MDTHWCHWVVSRGWPSRECIVAVHDRCSGREMGDSELTASVSVRFWQYLFVDGVCRLVVMMVVMMGLWALVPSHPDRRDD